MKTYYYSINGQAIGPVDEPVLKQMAQQGIITQATPVIEQGQSQWSSFGVLFPNEICSAAVPPPPVGVRASQPTIYRTRPISAFTRFFDTGYLAGFSPKTQMMEITFAEPQILIKMRDGRQLTLYEGQYEATDNLLGHAGSYNIEISTNDGQKLLIRGCDAELSYQGWEEIRKRLGCKNRLF